MALQMRKLIFGALPELRVHPTAKWVRATVGERTVVDTRAALLVWEPRRVVPSYAVPVADVAAELVPGEAPDVEEHPVRMDAGGPPVLDPSTAFGVHSCPGRSLTVRTPDGDLPGAAFAPDDPELDGYVVLDWDAFTQWYEEEQPVLGHPHDPYDRIDCLRSSRHVVLAAHGQVLADSRRPVLLLETPLPTRFYLPREDVRLDLMEPTSRRTVCAYKGHASYWSARVGDQVLPDIAWTYEDPLHDALPVAGLVAFFTERLDLTLDGVGLERPVTPWS